ncbi:catalytic LigB subunit of putative aromatic ring-opening dioxygenase [Leptodontidium sp. MPI-SDFR-AT-0119]|nr:catalytic LigB subunit of putative aromatic ring-opening dioxygenase [Leptodontidium sp. MPI-SDFR-AT-0119]
MSSNSLNRRHVLACSHGAGPFVLLSYEPQKPLIPVLDGIILATVHWETDQLTISAAAQHDLLFDYPRNALPKEAFEIVYLAPGHPELARKVAQRLEAVGFEPQLDHVRGWDHGVFVPMTYLRPQADIPIVQISCLKSQDTVAYIKIRQALGSLRDEGYAVNENVPNNNVAFEAALEQAMLIADANTRLERLTNWRSFPDHKIVHPLAHADYFMPFLVAAGAGAPDKTTKYTTWTL